MGYLIGWLLVGFLSTLMTLAYEVYEKGKRDVTTRAVMQVLLCTLGGVITLGIILCMIIEKTLNSNKVWFTLKWKRN